MRKIDLPTFMKWAFGEELVHLAQRAAAGSGGWSYIAAYGALGTVIDGGGASVPELSMVHPDAIVASEAVMLLAKDDFTLPAGWNPMADLDDPHGAIADVAAEVIARREMRDGASLNANLIALVISSAVMGREPEWRVDQPKFSLVQRGGKPAWFVTVRQAVRGRIYEHETDGYDRKAARPKPGAYRKYEVSQPFGGAVQSRIDWYLWTMAMEKVVDRLNSGLKSHAISPVTLDREPWMAVAEISASRASA